MRSFGRLQSMTWVAKMLICLVFFDFMWPDGRAVDSRWDQKKQVPVVLVPQGLLQVAQEDDILADLCTEDAQLILVRSQPIWAGQGRLGGLVGWFTAATVCIKMTR